MTCAREDASDPPKRMGFQPSAIAGRNGRPWWPGGIRRVPAKGCAPDALEALAHAYGPRAGLLHQPFEDDARAFHGRYSMDISHGAQTRKTRWTHRQIAYHAEILPQNFGLRGGGRLQGAHRECCHGAASPCARREHAGLSREPGGQFDPRRFARPHRARTIHPPSRRRRARPFTYRTGNCPRSMSRSKVSASASWRS